MIYRPSLKDLTQKDVGRWVRYDGGEVGRIKSWNGSYIFVVYSCNKEWDRYQDFTGAATRPDELEFISACCKAPMVNGGIQCETCGSNGL